MANTLAAVRAGATQVQGTMNGIGERCGNVDLVSVIANLALKYGYDVLKPESLPRLTETSRYVYELANMNFRAGQPFVGQSAFAHKGGMHTHAVAKDPATYEHIRPEQVGNERRMLVSELSGHSTILTKTAKYQINHDKPLMSEDPDGGAGSGEPGLRVRGGRGVVRSARAEDRQAPQAVGGGQDPQALQTVVRADQLSRQHRGSRERHADHRGHGADQGRWEGGAHGKRGRRPGERPRRRLRKALVKFFPRLAEMQLVDYKVRVVNPRAGTAARVRVVIESRDGADVWGTVGVSENIIEASWLALVDSIEYKLFKDDE